MLIDNLEFIEATSSKIEVKGGSDWGKKGFNFHGQRYPYGQSYPHGQSYPLGIHPPVVDVSVNVITTVQTAMAFNGLAANLAGIKINGQIP